MLFANIMALLLVSLLWSSCTTAEAEEGASSPITIAADSLEWDKKTGIALWQGNPFTGTAVVFQDTTKVAATSYQEGRKEGMSQKWFLDGQLSYKGFYKKGKQDGVAKTWWKNGNLRTKSHFKEGVAHGLQLSWYKSGTPFTAIQLVDGKEEGLQKAWRENGKIYNNYEAKNGRIFGLKRAALCYELEEEVVQ